MKCPKNPVFHLMAMNNGMLHERTFQVFRAQLEKDDVTYLHAPIRVQQHFLQSQMMVNVYAAIFLNYT